MDITPIDKFEITKTLRNEGYDKVKVDYKELKKLHKRFASEVSERFFVLHILGLCVSSYYNCVNKNTKIKIINKIQFSEESRLKIIEELKVKEGLLIDYSSFQKLHQMYGSAMSEKDFGIKILGLTLGKYYYCKKHNSAIRIKNGITQEKSYEIKERFFKKSKYYDKSYIEDICLGYELSIKEFMAYIACNGFFENNNHCIENLEKNKKMWLGKAKLTNRFIEKNKKIIEDTIKKAVAFSADRYKDMYEYNKNAEDYAQDIFIYTLKNLGFYERNYGDNMELFLRILFFTARKMSKFFIIHDFNLTCRNFSPVRYYKKEGKEFEVDFVDKNTNVENEVCNRIKHEEYKKHSEDIIGQCIMMLSSSLEDGLDRETAIKQVAKKMNLVPEEMITGMQRYILKKYQKSLN